MAVILKNFDFQTQYTGKKVWHVSQMNATRHTDKKPGLVQVMARYKP